jgi:hypothetical protein
LAGRRLHHVAPCMSKDCKAAASASSRINHGDH